MKRILCTTIVTLLIILPHGPIYGEQVKRDPFEIQLKSRKLSPPADRLTAFDTVVRRAEGERVHVLIQFEHIPDATQKLALQQAGVKLLNYVPQNTWFASVPVDLAVDHPALSAVRWIGAILPEDKLEPSVREERLGPSARDAEGRPRLMVNYFADADAEALRARLETLGAVVSEAYPELRRLVLVVPDTAILDLARDDAVQWVEPVPPPAREEADRARQHLQVDIVQAAGGDGSGVTVGVLEYSHANWNHPDFTTGGIARAHKGDTDATVIDHYHPTATAGFIAGDGEAGANGERWRGMAPGATVYSYAYQSAGGTPAEDANYIGDLQTAINTHRVAVAANAWGRTGGCYTSPYGTYSDLSPTLDAAVRGEAAEGFEHPVTIVFSAGNERDGWWDADAGTQVLDGCTVDHAAPYRNYSTMNSPKAAKNILAVGAVDSADNRMTVYSSWGPLADGRIKPEIVASGHHNGTNSAGASVWDAVAQGYLTTYHDTAVANYARHGLTSAAAAAASGAIALLFEAWRDQFPGLGDPLPSTVKALLVHSAQDLDDGTTWYNPGPDYASGYGLLQINDAIDLVHDESVIEDQVDNGQAVSYSFTVPAGSGPARFTLAWDDPPAVSGAAVALVNDLDLVITDSTGTRHFPWTLDPDPDHRADDARQDQEDHINNLEQVLVTPPGGGETYTVTVRGHLVPEGPQRFSLVVSPAQPLIAQNPVDVMLVLDLSGSMLSPACPDCEPKLRVLKDAVEIFMQLWWRMAVPEHRIGVTYFQDLEVREFTIGGDALFSVPDNAGAVIDDVQDQDTESHYLTPMGGGLQSAINRLTDDTRPRNIILFTDGMQNVNPMVLRVDGGLQIDNEPGRANSNVDPTPEPTVLDIDLGRKINTLGVGATDTFVALLNDIAASTGGVSRVTIAPDDNLRRFFVEQLVDALRESSPQIVDYRHGQLSSATRTESFAVTSSTRQLLLKVSWQRGQPPIEITRVEKDGVDMTQLGEIIRGDFYRIFSIELPTTPVTHGMHVTPQGLWQMRISGAAGTDYEVAAIADEAGLGYVFSLGDQPYQVGEPLQLLARLTVDGQPLTDAETVVARVFKPGQSIGTLLSTTATPSLGDGGEPAATGGQRKLELLLQRESFWNKLQPVTAEIPLIHQGDGYYSARFPDTNVPGTYTVEFQIAGEHPEIDRYTRTETLSTLVEFAQADLDASDLRIVDRVLGADVDRLRLVVRPRDIYGNYLGPDYSHRIAVSVSAGNVESDIRDRLDGSYEVLVTVPTGADPNINIEVMDQPLYVGPVSGIPTQRRLALSLHLGVAIPNGSFSNRYDTDYSVALDLDYHFTPQLAVVGTIGYNHFKGGSAGVGDTYWWNVTANAKYEFTTQRLRPYITGGAGLYVPEHGSTEPGVNGGLGIDYTIDNNWSLEAGVDYHLIFTSGSDTEFFNPRIGLLRRF
ncbi:MAG: S8 family serine peptidase [Desulfuromonadales bacterium]|nr:S8 family serine peptidase [Desulfuromonadales bacterium]